MVTGFIEGKFLPLHNGHLNAIKHASEMVEKLYVVLGFNDKRDKQLCKDSSCKEMPFELRLSWLGHELKHLKNIEIHAIEDYDDKYDFFKMIPEHKSIFNTEKLDYVFSSEPSYDPIFKQLYPNAKHILIDPKRQQFATSGGSIRKNPFQCWDDMPSIVRKHFVKKVLITGVESVGKSTMTKLLAEHFNTNYVYEIGRYYCEKFDNLIIPKHFIEIAMKHFTSIEDLLEHSNKYLFIDTDAIITQYYLLKYHNISTNKLLDHIVLAQDFDLTFYLEPTVPWVNDGYRFLENSREDDNKYLKQFYPNAIFIDSPDYKERFKQVVNHITN